MSLMLVPAALAGPANVEASTTSMTSFLPICNEYLVKYIKKKKKLLYYQFYADTRPASATPTMTARPSPFKP